MKDKKTVIGIRADGSVQIGMGHLMRCISIAKALERERTAVLFFTANEESREVIQSHGFACHVLVGELQNMDEELPELLQALKIQNVELLLVDSYRVTKNYMRTLNKVCPVFYMDDMGESFFEISGVINYNIYGQELSYKENRKAGTTLLLGSSYAPVKQEFTEQHYEVQKEVRKILLTMGGSDSLNIAGTLGKRLLACTDKQICLEVICGKFNPHREELEKLSQENPRLYVLTDVQDMWKEMASADIAISAAGSTMYELSTLGVPAVCCYYVENQRRIAEGFARYTEVVNAGNYADNGEKTVERIVREVQRLTGDYDKRKALSVSMQKVTDGQGAGRLARQLKIYAEREQETKTE